MKKTPTPAPRLSRTPGTATKGPSPIIGQHTVQILEENGFKSHEIQNLLANGAILQAERAKL